MAKSAPPPKSKTTPKAAGTNGLDQSNDKGKSSLIPVASGSRPPPALALTEPTLSEATLDDVRHNVQLRMGQLLLAVARLPRYRDLTVKTLMATLLEPLQRGQIAFAEVGTGKATLIGMAVWARVSDAVNATIMAQVEAGTFPVQLAANDWVSGETIWLLDLIVPSRKAGTAVFTNFTKVIGEKPFKLHPVVAGSLDADLVAQINSLAAAPGAAKPSAKTESETGTKASSDPLHKDDTP